jgi:hypothetical protein
MPYNINIIQAREFIRATPNGVLDFEQSKELLIAIAAAAQGLGEYAVLLDLRRATSELSVTDMWYLAKHLNSLHEAHHRKTAVLGTFAQFAHIEFFALAGQNRGAQIRAFTLFEDAIEWLIA